MTLIKHVKFFDSNNTGKITRGDIYKGLRKLKIDRVRSFIGSVLLIRFLSKKTGGNGKYIDINNIEKAAHFPNDTGGFDPSYNLILDKEQYTIDDIKELIKKRGKVNTSTFVVEWDLLFNTLGKFRELKNDKGENVISKQEIQQLFDGSLFYKLTGTPE